MLLVEGNTEKTVLLDHTPFSIGRQPVCDLVIADPTVSRSHALIVTKGRDYFIVDQDSRHGTFLNGRRVEEDKIQTNDVIHFGSPDGCLLRFGVSPFTHHSTMREFIGLFQSVPDESIDAGNRLSSQSGNTRMDTVLPPSVIGGRKAREYRIPGKLGPFKLLREIGRGGSTVVCLAQNEYSAVGRQVALKLPLFEQDKRRVAHEAKLWKRLSDKAHPNIVNLEDLNMVDGITFFVMEYLEGGSLDAALQQVSEARRVEVVLDALPGIVEGLAFAHSQGVVHGDIKPQNILLCCEDSQLPFEQFHVKIGDFGLSLPAKDTNDANQRSEIAGTFSFMAPESFDGLRNYQTDIYAFGATLYYLITERYLHSPSESLDELKGKRMDFTPDLSAIVGLPPWLASTVQRCMDPVPDNRFKDATELRDYVVPLVEPRKARRIVLTAWCNPESESVDYDLEISGERSREMLNVEVTNQTVAGLASEFDRIGDLAIERLHARAGAQGVREIEGVIKQSLSKVSEDGSHFVLGSKVRKILTAEKASALWLLYDPRLAGVPWELLDVDGLPMCRRFSFSRWPKLRSLSCPTSYRLDGDIHVLIVSNPSGDLPGATEECSRLIREFRDSPLAKRLKVEVADERDNAFSIRSKMRRCQILHYAGHAVFSDRAGDLTRSGWLLKGSPQYPSSGDLLRAGGLSDFWTESPPLLVFANACRSGQGSAKSFQQRVSADAAMGLAQAFLGAGVGNYLGTVWESPDDGSTGEFASAFYREFLSGRSVGDSVVLARNHCAMIFGEEDLAWARYALFGDPLSHIVVRWRDSGRV